MVLLITRPLYDPTTHYLHYWGKSVVDIARAKGIQVIDLESKRANRRAVEGVIKKKSPTLVLLNGHGNERVMAGHEHEHLIIAGDNDHILQNTVVYALSCKTGHTLGPICVSSGALAYIGYSENFNFWTNSSYTTRPLEDPRAKMFLEPSNAIATSLIKGHTAKEARDKGKEEFLRNIQKLIVTNSPDQFMIPDLLWDMSYLVMHGDENAVAMPN